MVMMVLEVYPADCGSATLITLEHSSVTALSLGKLPCSLPILDAFTLQGTANDFCTFRGSGTVRITVEIFSWSITTDVSSTA